MHIDFLFSVFRKSEDKTCIVWKGESYTYSWLIARIKYWQEGFQSSRIEPGEVVSLEADFSPEGLAVLLALIETGCVVMPLTQAADANKSTFLEVGNVAIRISVSDDSEPMIVKTGVPNHAPLLRRLKEEGHPGLILWTSGSTGNPKAVVHDLVLMLGKYQTPRNPETILAFLLFDHLGGVDTLFYVLANGGCVVTVEDRAPETVLAAIEKCKVGVLPTSPSFLNLMLLSTALSKYDLSSLKRIVYGAETMPESTLAAIRKALPHVNLQQSYGISELGVLRSKSLSPDSLWMKVGGEGVNVRVVDGIIQIKSPTAMLGYLNAPTPFTDDGWFVTGDEAEVDGEFLRIRGRRSDIINVGGLKVYPAEIESVLRQMDGVEDVIVQGERNPILGNLVVAKFRISTSETNAEFIKRARAWSKSLLQPHQVPQKILVENTEFSNARFKKVRAV